MCKFAFYPQFAPSRAKEKIDSEGGVISFGSCIMVWVRLVMSACVVFNVFIVFEVEGRVKVEPPR
jgi:hypothetical protein